MGYREMCRVRASGLTDRTQVDVLEALAYFQNSKTGKCFPSTEALARVSRVNPNLVRKTIRDLVQAGLVSCVQDPGRTRFFTLNLSKLPEGVDVPEPLEESEGVKETTPLEVREVDPFRKVKYPPLGSSRGPLEVPKAEQGIEQGIEQGREQGSFSPAFACDAPADGVAHKTGVTPSPDDWASLLSETAPSDDVPTGLFDDMPPEPAPKPAAKKPKRSRAASDAWPVEGDSIDAETRAAYIAVRKAKRVGPFTAKAYEQIKAQGEKFGRSMVETLGICIGRGWVYPYDSAFQQTTMNGKSNGIQEDRRGFVLTPQSEYDYEAGLRMFEERRAARRARDA